MSSNSNIVLIGFMGSGKSTVARALAKRMSRFFIDSDDLIEKLENRTISEIFESEGETYFRAQEQKCLAWMLGALKNSVISTGGGLPIYADGVKKLGTVVFLKSDFEVLKERIWGDSTSERPLMEDETQAKKLFDERMERYEALSDITVDGNGEVASVVREILTKVALSH